MASRTILKASRPVPDLTGRENIRYVDPKRIYNYGYKRFLNLGKIEEIFGEKIAKSKRVRKAKIREILHNIMHTFDLKEDFDDDAVIDDFIEKTEEKLKGHIAEIQAMKSSVEKASPSVSVKKKEATKRKKESREKEGSDMRVDIVIATSPKKEINPIENQIDFLSELMKTTTDPSKPSTLTVRQVEARFKQAQQKDRDAIKRAEEEQERAKKAEKKRKVIAMNKEIRDDLTLLLEKTGL